MATSNNPKILEVTQKGYKQLKRLSKRSNPRAKASVRRALKKYGIKKVNK